MAQKTTTTKRRTSPNKGQSKEDIGKKINEAERNRENKKAVKPKPTTFFGNFKETMKDDMKGTSIILGV